MTIEYKGPAEYRYHSVHIDRLMPFVSGVIPSEWTRDAVMKAKPRRKFVPEDIRRDHSYHLGRIRYFMEQFKYRERVKPIWIESQCHQYRVGCPISWGPPFIEDGRHRLVAAKFAGKRRIWVSFGGLLSQLEYLEGKRDEFPYDE